MAGRIGRQARYAAVAALVAAAALAGDARASSPTATTGPATAIGATSATVTGTVDPGGQSTSWYVEYGTATSYGSKSASTSAGSGTAAVAVSAKLSSLAAATTYHYRIVATNGAGTSRGADAVLTTLAPPAAVTGTATSVSATAATLNGTVDANGRATTYVFEYGTSTGYGTQTAAKSAGSGTSAQPVSVTVTGLQAGRTYHFRLVAESDAGTSSGKDATFATSGVPAVVTGSPSSITPTGARLNGTVTPNGLSTSWWFEYGTTTRYGSRTSSHSAGSGASPRSVSTSVGRLRPATTYHVRLVAQNAQGRAYGDDRVFSTVGPPFVQTGAAQQVGSDAAVLTGSLDTRGRSTTWWFEYGTSTRYGSSTSRRSIGSRAGQQAVSVGVTGLHAATAYHVRLVARSDAGTTYGADASFTTTGVTLTAAAHQLVFGGRIRLFGTVPTRQAGEQVVIFAQAYGGDSFHSVATVLTGVGGAWSYLARPGIRTAYQASWHGGVTEAFTVGVHPRVALTRLKNGRFLVSVRGGRSFAHRVVQLQRRVGARWVTVKRVRLGARARAEFRATLPKGRSTVRAAFSVNQAGAGFLGGTSRLLVVRR